MREISAGMAERAGRTYRGATIAWGRGECYDYDRPNPEIITLDDIAHALAFTVRWRGQTIHRGRRCFFGVGQHCIFGAEEMLAEGYSRAQAFAFLVHEPDEITLPDYPGPAKQSVPGLREFAKRQGEAICAYRGWIDPDPDLTKAIDLRMMVTEKRDLMPGHQRDIFHSSARASIDEQAHRPFAREIIPYDHPAEAAPRWLELYHELFWIAP
jgi:hypothetical protein